VLEPDQHPAVRPFKEALVNDGIPFTSFTVEDVERDFERLSARGCRGRATRGSGCSRT